MQTLDIDYLAGRKWWFIHKRMRTPFFTYMLWEGLSKHRNEEITFPYECHRLISLTGELAFDQEDWDNNQAAVTKEFENDPDFIMSMFKKAYSLNERILRIVKDIQSKEIKELSNEELADLLNTYYREQIKSSAFMAFPMVMEKYLDDSITKVVKAAFPEDSDRIIHTLTTCIRPSDVQNEEMDILKIAIKQNEGKVIKDDIKNHIAEFGWLKNASMDGQFYTREDVEEKINLVVNNKPEDQLEKIEKDRVALSKMISTYKKQLKKYDVRMPNLIDTLQEAIFFRSWRTERFYRNVQYLQNFLTEIADRISLENSRDLFYLVPPEIDFLLRKNAQANLSLIAERKDGFIMTTTQETTEIYSGKIVNIAKDKIKLMETKGDASSLKGQTAYPGKVVGKACLIYAKTDFGKMQDGNILISHSTTPDYVPLIKKSKAIVTDEGGVLSHASVISRELQIPCVIGTKVATKIFKDGDLVEVDAEKGIVKILK